ncbi:myb/SANT-like DNA-binding domain-containing protein 4 isoform X2 [Engraulis encrasicolus]
MDFLKKDLKRKRKSNYSVKETQTLIREIHKRRDVLFSRQQNTAINELKRRAWDEVADCVNALGEGELRTAAEVKRRYLDWRALMKRKQLRAELASSGMKNEYKAPCLSPDHDAASLGAGEPSLDMSAFGRDGGCDWQDLPDLGEPSSHTSSGIKMEDDDPNEYRLDGDPGEAVEAEVDGEDDDDDCFPSLLPNIDREGRGVPEVFAHIDEFGMLSSSKASSLSAGGRADLSGLGGLGGGIGVGVGVGGMSGVGMGLNGLAHGLAHGMGLGGGAGEASTGLLIALEKQRLDLEKHRLQVESERLQVEKERLLLEKERLRQAESERERLQLERERLQVERERLRLLMCQSSAANATAQNGLPSSTSAATPSTSSSTSSSTAPTSSTLESAIGGGGGGGDKDRKPGLWPGYPVCVDLEAEKLKLEKERLLLEKERLQFFKFESGRLQIEKERLQVEKERLQLHKDGQQMALHQ